MRQFPSWNALAQASSEQVLKAWEGLGYYTRARNLHAVAKQVVEAGTFPRDHAQLIALPGFGPYTAAAVGSIAFGLPFAALDGNVMRVLTRLEAITDPIDQPKTRRDLQRLADDWLISGLATESKLPRNIPGDHNQAVMELGATLCLPRKPQCLICPLNSDCKGRFDPESYPVKRRVETILRDETIALIYDETGRILCQQVGPNQAWAGLWRIPIFDKETMEVEEGHEPLTMKYGITKYRVTLSVVRARLKQKSATADSAKEEAPQFGNRPASYHSIQELNELTIVAPHRKVLKLYKMVSLHD
jgi:A/G-specific adenine glycosylase